MQKKVSVIVPIYNAQKTLASCLGNLVHQTLSEMELILVNDASTDGSLNIMLDCEQAFSDKVIVVNLDRNLGPGGARNAGLAYASGEYIGFVDSDDVPDIHMYEKLYTLAVSGEYDMVDGAYYDERTDTFKLQTADSCRGILNEKKRSELIAGGGYLWSRLIRRELFDKFFFREHTILEDMETLMILFMRTKRLGTTRDLVYKYNNSDTSASKPSDPAYYHKAVTDAMRAVAEAMIPMENYAGVQLAVEYSILHLYQCGIVNALHPNNTLSEDMKNSYLDELRKLRFKYVKIPYEQNAYMEKKFSKEDLRLMQNVDTCQNREG